MILAYRFLPLTSEVASAVAERLPLNLGASDQKAGDGLSARRSYPTTPYFACVPASLTVEVEGFCSWSAASLSRSGSLTAAQDLIGYMVEPKNGLKAPP